MKHQGYFTRALKARDPRFARIFSKLGYDTSALISEDESAINIVNLRDTYEKVVGKRPFMGWDAETLAAKIAEARGA